MTDPLDPLDPLDLEASAALDDDRPGVDPGSRSPEIARRIEAFRQVRAAVGAPVDPPPAAAREAAVAAALGAFDPHREDLSDPAAPGVAVVTPLRRRRSGGRWLGAAAAAAVLVLGAAAVLSGGFGGPDQDDTAATATGDEATELDAADADAEAAAPLAGPEPSPDDAEAEASMTFGDAAGRDGAAGPVSLGAHDDVEGLVRSLSGPVEEALRSSRPTTTAAQRLDVDATGDACDDTRSALAAEGPIVLEGDALVAGTLVRVLVVDTRTIGDADERAAAARREVVLADPGGVGCPVLERAPLG